jgi:hypothetical protein
LQLSREQDAFSKQRDKKKSNDNRCDSNLPFRRHVEHFARGCLMLAYRNAMGSLDTSGCNLCARLFGKAQAGAFAGFADPVQLDGLRAAAVARRTIAAFNPAGPAAVGAANVLGAPHKTDAFAAWAVPDGHAFCIQQPRILRNRFARGNPPITAFERRTARGLSTPVGSSRKMLKTHNANGESMAGLLNGS